MPANAKLLVGDITTPGIFNDIAAQVDGCFHLAAIVSVQKSTEEWLRTHQVNLSGMVALLDALAFGEHKIPVVFASSAAVYGDCSDIPLKETAHTTPLSAYGADKLGCELHAAVAASVHGIPAIGLRFFNVYGPRQDPYSAYSGVISIFADRMKQHLPVTIYGDGEQSRDFIYVGDVVNALAASMQRLESRQLVHGVFNVCTGRQVSINELASMISTITTSRLAITHAAARAGDIRFSLGNPSSARQSLGVQASVSLHDGLRKTLEG